jgi:heme-degrading monooxygenase HmoA
VFRSRLRDGNADDFSALAEELRQTAETMPGFRSYKVFTADDGERCSLIEFDTPEQLRDWREQPRHREAQQLGRERYYDEYSLQVSESWRESRFRR